LCGICLQVHSKIESFEGALSIETLASMSGFSRRNFQLYFRSFTNDTVGQYIKRLRLERGLQLAKSGNWTNAEIAYKIGYANTAAYNNALKKDFGKTPREMNVELRSKQRFYEGHWEEPELIELPETPVLYLSFTGDYDTLSSAAFEEKSWDELYQLADSKDLLPSEVDYWGICFNDTDITDESQCRFYACLSIKSLAKTKRMDKIKSMTIPSGLYASFRHVGPYEELNAFYNSILQNLPEHYMLGSGAILERYLNSPVDTCEVMLQTEVLLPVIKC